MWVLKISFNLFTQGNTCSVRASVTILALKSISFSLQGALLPPDPHQGALSAGLPRKCCPLDSEWSLPPPTIYLGVTPVLHRCRPVLMSCLPENHMKYLTGWAKTWRKNQLEKVPFVSVLHTSSNRLLLSNQDKGCTPSVAHSLPLPLGPTLLNLWTVKVVPEWQKVL